MKRWLAAGGVALVVLVALAAGTGAVWWRGAVPVAAGSFTAPVAEPVTIHMDARGRPYVLATTLDDAFVAQGWLHARDRLWQMELFRRGATGRVAEAIGPAGLATDLELWRAGVPELGQRLRTNASPRLARLVERYVAGINAYLRAGAPRPPEFAIASFDAAPWQVDDVFAMGALMAFQSANNYRNELLRLALLDRLGAERGRIFTGGSAAPMPDFGVRTRWQELLARADLRHVDSNPLLEAPSLGSNAWAVAPARAEGNAALFAFDSHDAFGLPNLTYDVHLFFGEAGSQHVRGTSVAGLPGVINGFNEFMAWGFTNIGDSQDLFIEQRHPEPPLRFRDGDEWYAPERRHVEIPVRGADAHRFSVVITRNGRLISEAPDLSLRWSPLEADVIGLDALLALNRATSLAAFDRAIDGFAAPSANVTYADVAGNIVQRTLGVLPQRGRGNGLVPLPGDDPSARWQGFWSPATLPRQHNPVDGVVWAANRPLAAVPPVSADNAPGYRSQRLAALLQAERLDSAAMRAMQRDTFNGQARRLLPAMLAALDVGVLSEAERRAFDALSSWLEDPRDEAELGAPLLFAAWYQHLATTLFREALGEDLLDRLLRSSYVLNEALDNHLLAGNPGSWPVAAALRSAFRAAVADAGVDGRWGARHTLTLAHELSGAFPGSAWLFDRGPVAASGGNATVGRARYSYRQPYAVSGGATTRLVVALSQPMQAWSIMPGGQSGIPASPHYNDQTAAWVAGTHDTLAQRPRDLPVAFTLAAAPRDSR